MYRVTFNGYTLHDPRSRTLQVRDPRVHLAVGEAGEMSFVIDCDHPNVGVLTRLRGILSLHAGSQTIFRGRVKKDTRDFTNALTVEVEGLLACLNDSLTPPFDFPGDFLEDTDYQTAAASGNVVEFFLGWLLAQHNGQVGAAQQIQLGEVTVTDPNNYIARSSTDYVTTLETVRSKLEELLGGYLLVDYSGDTTVLNYYADLPLTNVQEVTFGDNLLDFAAKLDATDTYTAILPVGKDGLTIADLSDGEISPGIWKEGLLIYSADAEENLDGRITKKVEWKDVTEAANLRTKAAAQLAGDGVKQSRTIEVKAADIGGIDDIPHFVVGRYVKFDSAPHGFADLWPLMELDPDILDPGNTEIVLGDTVRTLTGLNSSDRATASERIEMVKQELSERIDGIKAEDGTYFFIRYSASAGGANMTIEPEADTVYMGTCSSSSATAPTDPTVYTWVKVKGDAGETGATGADGPAGESPVISLVDSSGGYTLKPGETVTLTARVFEGTTEIDPDGAYTYTWYASTDSGDYSACAVGKTITVSADSYSKTMDIYFVCTDGKQDGSAVVGVAVVGVAIVGNA